MGSGTPRPNQERASAATPDRAAYMRPLRPAENLIISRRPRCRNRNGAFLFLRLRRFVGRAISPAADGVAGRQTLPVWQRRKIDHKRRAGSRPRRGRSRCIPHSRFVMHVPFGRRGGMYAARERFRYPERSGPRQYTRGGRNRPPYNATGWGGRPIIPAPHGNAAGSRPRPTPMGSGAPRPNRERASAATPDRAAYMRPLHMAGMHKTTPANLAAKTRLLVCDGR